MAEPVADPIPADIRAMTRAERRTAGRREPGVSVLLAPKWRSTVARLRQERSGTRTKLLLLLAVGSVFWAAIFGIAWRVLRHAKQVPELGALLPGKMLALMLLAFGSILLLSNLITALSTFFLARDLDLLVAAPVDWLRLYLAKLLETMVHSSWMVALLALPVFTAYGIVLDGGPLFPFVVLGAVVPFLALPAVLGSAATLLLVNIFPARRAKDILGIVSIGAVGVVVVVLRIVRPEQLVRPEGYRNLLDFLALLRAPTSPWLPTEWAASMVMNWLRHVADPLPIALLWTTAGAFVVFGALLHRRLYGLGYTRSHEGAERVVRRPLRGVVLRFLGRLTPEVRELVLKDMRLFFRDSTQWSQLILLAVLVLVYIFNIRMLPLFSGERVPFLLVTAISFLNLGLAGFVLSAVAARFVFPAVSLEGRQLWLLRSSPLDLRRLLWSKYWTGTLPLLVLAVALTASTNYLLRVSPFMMWLGVGTIVLFTLAASALALGLGALYPQYDTENAAQIPTSFGGLVFMMTSITLLVLILVIEARPVLGFLQASTPEERPVGELAVSLGAVAVICLGTTWAAIRLGLRKVAQAG
jgi:ABC-2 type transport system permease protein